MPIGTTHLLKEDVSPGTTVRQPKGMVVTRPG
jgi:hypothetical protein